MSIDPYRRKYAYGEDYGTSYFKYGPIAEKPHVIENRGFIIPKDSIMFKIVGISKEVVVGPEVAQYLGSREDTTQYLIYPMRDGIVERDNEKAWKIIYEITKFGFSQSMSAVGNDFKGFYVTAALSAIAPLYMYEKIFEIHRKIDEELGAISAVTIIPQPLAVAISQKIVTCTVVESGHGNTQITPISRYPIRNAIVSLNRGGAEADAITAEILKDLGYGDLAGEEKLVRLFKEKMGLIPIDLNKAINFAKNNKDLLRDVFEIPGTLIKIEMNDNSWMRFLIGEIVFNPEHEVFESYYKRGMPRPKDTKIGDERIRGTTPLGQAIAISISKTSIELQQHLYQKIILSGGNFAWGVPEKLKQVACDAAFKVRLQLKEILNIDVNVSLTDDPLYSVWKGTIVYSVAVPDDYLWNWDKLEGWYKRGVHF